MQVRYLFREGASSFRRTKLASTITVVTIALALTLLGGYGFLSINFGEMLRRVRSGVALEVFLLPDAQVPTLQSTIRAIPGVDSVRFISPAEAMAIFEADTKENVHALLDSSPFPASFHVSLADEAKLASRAQSIAEAVDKLDGVDSVVYRSALVEQIDRAVDAARTIGLIAGGGLALIALLLVSNTIRLGMYAKRRTIRTLALVGATPGFVRAPFLVEGVLHGLIGAVIAGGILAAFLEGILPRLIDASYVRATIPTYLSLLVVGALLGLIGSIIPVVRFLRKQM